VVRLDDFSHGHAELVFDKHHFATRHQPVVDVDIDRSPTLRSNSSTAPGPSFKSLPTSI
jgi:hypothetical protein